MIFRLFGPDPPLLMIADHSEKFLFLCVCSLREHPEKKMFSLVKWISLLTTLPPLSEIKNKLKNTIYKMLFLKI